MNKSRQCFFILALTVLVGLLAGSPALGQATKGSLVGLVADQSGAAIPGAEVTVTNQGTNQASTTITTDVGSFQVRALNPGLYQVEVALTGFKTAVARDVKVNVGEEYSLNVVLEIGEVAETVTVLGGADQVDTTDVQVSTTIQQQEILDLPLQGRNPMNLILLQAGAAQNGHSPTSISGLRVSFTNITQDGVNIQDNFIRSNATTFTPNRLTQSMVSEFTISSAVQGTSSGFGASQVNFVTPAGTNDFNGEVVWVHRNNKFAANGFFPNKAGSPKPKLIRNQFGFFASGPVIKDKLLWYANYEGYRDRQEDSKLNTVVTSSARQGIFRYNATDGSGVKEVDLLGLRGLSPDSTIQALLQRVPTEINDLGRGDGLNTGGYRFNMTNNEDRDQYGFRLDYILNDAHSFEGIYRHNSFLNDRPDIYNGFETTPKHFTESSPDFLSTAWNWTVSPSIINEVRFGFNLSGVVFEDGEDRSAGYKIEVNSFDNPVENFERQGRDVETWNFSDNASWSRGAHSFRFGFQAQNVRILQFNSFNLYPTFGLGTNVSNGLGLSGDDFEGGISSSFLNTANNILADLGGILDTADAEYNIQDRNSGFQAVQDAKNWKYDIYGFYFGDSWRMSPRLTLNAGLRWEIYQPLRERDGLITQPVVSGGDYVGAVIDPDNVVDFVTGDLIKKDTNNFAPNVGLAWDIFGDGKTALRAGYGIAYVNDEMQRAPGNAINRYGVAANVSLIELTGFLTSDRPSLPAPDFKVPLSWDEISNPASPYFSDSFPASYSVNPNMVTPYAQTWQVGLQREVFWNMAVEGRYVGTKGSKLSRAIDLNQVIIFPNGFLNDFKNAQQNAELASAAGLGYDARYNPDVQGSVPLPVFDQVVGGGLLTNSTIRRYLQENRAGQTVYIYHANGLCGGLKCVENPAVAVADALSNGADSTYHALQLEVRRRFQGGLNFFGNYTFGKTLTNAAGAGQSNFEPILDLGNAAYDRGRASYSVTHVFNASLNWQLPFGRGKRFDIENSVLNQILGGWQATSIFNWQSGDPFTPMSNRGTLNRDGRSAGRNRASTDLGNEGVRNLIGLGDDASGPTYINPQTRSDGTFYHPEPGELGSLPRYGFDGTSQFVWDLGMIKRFTITEGTQLEFRAELFNATNKTNFHVGDEAATSSTLNIDSSNFGRITSTNTGARVTQFSLKFLF